MARDTLTAVQFVVASKLARALDHHWGHACHPPPCDESATREQALAVADLIRSVNQGRVPLDVVQAVSLAFLDDDGVPTFTGARTAEGYGVLEPRLDEAGWVVHRTKPQRTSVEWRVSSLADVVATVYRGDVEVIVLRADPLGVSGLEARRSLVDLDAVQALEPLFDALEWPSALLSLLYAMAPDGIEYFAARRRFREAEARGELN